jgi:hypothetical protein
MKAILPSLFLLAVAALGRHCPAQQSLPQGNEANGGSASSVAGELLVDRVIATLDAHQAIAAKIRHRVELLARPLIGTGIYLQQGRGDSRAFRLEVQLRTSSFGTNMQHLCDGNRLWISEELDGNRKVTLVDMARLRNARPKSRGPVQPHQPAALPLAGLPKLLAGLQDNFCFATVRESQLDDLPVWSIAGTWEPHKLVQLLPDQKDAIEAGQAADLSRLAGNLPQRMVLHVGSDDLFPYRLEYWRSESRGDDSEATGERLIVVMELYEVRLGTPLDPAQFVYRPQPNLAPVDRTKEYLERFGLEDPPPEEAKRQLRSPL